MAWDATTHRLITQARLKLAEPDVVYHALESYGQFLVARSRWDYDKELENALLGRDNRLIDLALAKNAASDDVVGGLYRRSLEGTSDPDYDKAVRLACLANQAAVNMLLPANSQGIDATELRRLALQGDSDELGALMRNPGRRNVLVAAYGRQGVFENIPDERWFHLVSNSVDNPGLNVDESNVYGPDFTAWDLQKAIVGLLQTAPVEPRWIYALYSLLLTLNPENARSLESKAAFQELLARWKAARVPKTLDKAVDAEGYYSTNTLVEEFCGVMAALYGHIFENRKFEQVGAFDSEDLVLRCAHYGRGEMSPEQMGQAWEKDGNLFALTALFNNQLLLKTSCRQRLEDFLPSDLQHVYARRCSQLQTKYKWFDPRPVTDGVKEELEESAPPADAAMVDRLSAQVVNMKEQVAALSKQIWWGAIILTGLVLWHR
ncbi:hypothetical protein HI792_15885 [Ralstonia solanacearum]|nr:hypothetical protein HI792_15885 [Ralstonia solanacearum]